MDNTRNEKSIARPVLIIFLIICFFAATLFALYWWESANGDGEIVQTGSETVQYNGVDYVKKSNIETFLIMGLDTTEVETSADSYNNKMQADFLLLLIFDKDTQKSSAIHINRDTMTDMNILGVAGQKVGTVNGQIALSHTYGNGKGTSCRNTADAVSNLLNGIKVDHYLSVTMDFVPIFNDMVGGVEVTVLDDFTSVDPTLVKGETVTLMGDQALLYVRTRRELADSSNSTRMIRQRQYLNALYEKTLQCIESDEQFIVSATLAMSDYVVTDRSATRLQELAKKMTEYEFTGINTIEGESRMGEKFVEFYASKDSITEVVMNLFYKIKE